MAVTRTEKALPDALPQLLRDRGLTLRQLAQDVGIDHAHLSRVIARVGSKRASGDLARRVAESLGLPADYFPEYRAQFLIKRIESDATLRDELYDHVVEPD